MQAGAGFSAEPSAMARMITMRVAATRTNTLAQYGFTLFPAEMGYSYGHMLANEISEVYNSLVHSLIGDKWYNEVR